MQNPGAPIGIMISIIFINCGLEALVCYKFGVGMFPTPMPLEIKCVLKVFVCRFFVGLYLLIVN